MKSKINSLLQHHRLVFVAFTAAVSALGSANSYAVDGSWNGTTNALWSTATNWSGGVVPDGRALFVGTGNGNTTIDLGSGVSANNLFFDATPPVYTIGAGAVGSQTLTLTGSSITLQSTITNTPIISANLAVTSGNIDFNLNSASAGVNVAGGLSGAASSINKNGIGTLTFSGANSYTGGTFINAGTLIATSAAGTPFGTGSFTLRGAAVSIAPTGSGTDVALTGGTGTGTSFNINGASDNSGPGAGGNILSLNKGSQTSLTYTFGNGTSTLNRGVRGTLVIQGSAADSIGSTTGERFILNGTAPANHVTTANLVNAPIVLQNSAADTTGQFAKYDAVNGFISTAANYTTVNGTAPSTASGAIWDVTAPSTVTGTVTDPIAALRVGATTLTLGSSQNLTVGNLAADTAQIILNGGTIASTATEALALGASEGTIYTSGANGTISAKITGTNGLTTFGPGALTLSGANAYSGNTTVNSGTLILNNASALGTSTLRMTGGSFDTTVAGITLANNPSVWVRDVTFLGTQSLNLGTGSIENFNARRVITVNANTLTIGGSILNGGFDKKGAGALALNGASSNSTLSLLNAGTLILNNGSSGNTTSSSLGKSELQIFGGNLDSTVPGVVLGTNNVFRLFGNVTFLGTESLDLGSGQIEVSGTKTLTVNAKTLTTSGALTNGNLIKAGAGTFVTKGVNTYGGSTTVSAGLLDYQGTLASGGGTITVGNTASTSARLNIASSGTIQTGNLLLGNNSTGAGAVYHTSGTFNLAGNSSVSNFALGASASGYGYYNLSGGDVSAREVALGGDYTSSIGVFEMSGGTLTIKSDGYGINVGRGGGGSAGQFIITGGAVSSKLISVNANAGANSGAISALTIGGGVGPASFSISNTTNGLYLGNGNAGTQGIVNLRTNGTLTTSQLVAGNSNSQVNLNGGKLVALPTSTAGSSFMTQGGNVYVYGGGATFDNSGINITLGKALLAPAGYGVAATTISVPSGGSGYVGAPLVKITGGTGSGATGYAVLTSGAVSSIVITNPGTGYGAGDTLTATFIGGGATVAATDVSISGASLAANTSGGITFTGTGITTLTGANTYKGDTIVTGGTLAVNGSALADSSKLVINGGVVAPTGTETVNTLFFGAVQQAAGTWGATGSGATHIDNTRFSGTGVVNVITAPSSYGVWAATNVGGQSASQDFDNDGVTNGVEYFMNSAAGFTANPSLVSGTITWTNGGNIPNTAYGTQYVVQTSQDLVTWTNVPVGSLTTNTNGPAGSLSYTPPTGQGKYFVRLMVVPN